MKLSKVEIALFYHQYVILVDKRDRCKTFFYFLHLYILCNKIIHATWSVKLLSTLILQKCICMLMNSIKNGFMTFLMCLRYFEAKISFFMYANSCMTSFERLSIILFEKSRILWKNDTGGNWKKTQDFSHFHVF